MRIGVIDVGTNVFGLLLASVNESGELNFLDEFKVGAKLGEGGFSSGALTEKAFNSAELAFTEIFRHISAVGGVDVLRAFATSAVRDSSNGKEFAKRMEEKFSFKTDIITGDQEAKLIYYGVRESMFLWGDRALMMDIGGGSVEFIIGDSKEIFWKKSFPLGMGRLWEMFNPSDPIKDSEVKLFEEYCIEELGEMVEACRKFSPDILIGSSGSFDTLRDILYPEDIGIKIVNEGFVPSRELEIDKLTALTMKMRSSRREERAIIPGMSELRVNLMVLSSLFTMLVLRLTEIKSIYQSGYSLKEGALFLMAKSELESKI